MRVSGLNIIKNGVRFDYPFREAIRSALPLCDEFIVVVGKSDDGTLESLQELAEPKVRVVETEWSDKVRPQAHVLAQQTNIGLHMCSGDWVLNIQANEVLHEASLPVLKETMQRHLDDPRVEALLFEYLDFWGDYHHVVPVYPHRFKYVPRILRPYIGTYAIRDAMSVAVFDGFSRKGRYPGAVDTGQDIFRYGNVRGTTAYADKQDNSVHRKGIDDGRPRDRAGLGRVFPRSFIKSFTGTHPAVMAGRIERFDERLSLDDPYWRIRPSWRERQRLVETWFYRRFGVPRLRNTRYRLLGGYRDKPRD